MQHLAWGPALVLDLLASEKRPLPPAVLRFVIQRETGLRALEDLAEALDELKAILCQDGQHCAEITAPLRTLRGIRNTLRHYSAEAATQPHLVVVSTLCLPEDAVLSPGAGRGVVEFLRATPKSNPLFDAWRRRALVWVGAQIECLRRWYEEDIGLRDDLISHHTAPSAYHLNCEVMTAAHKNAREQLEWGTDVEPFTCNNILGAKVWRNEVLNLVVDVPFERYSKNITYRVNSIPYRDGNLTNKIDIPQNFEFNTALPCPVAEACCVAAMLQDREERLALCKIRQTGNESIVFPHVDMWVFAAPEPIVAALACFQKKPERISIQPYVLVYLPQNCTMRTRSSASEGRGGARTVIYLRNNVTSSNASEHWRAGHSSRLQANYFLVTILVIFSLCF